MFLKFNYHDLSELRIVKVISVYMKLGRLIKYIYFLRNNKLQMTVIKFANSCDRFPSLN